MGHIENLIFGYEEAIGYCVDPQFVRDKDGVATALLLVELFSYLKSQKLEALDILNKIYEDYGVHITKQVSFRFDSVEKANPNICPSDCSSTSTNTSKLRIF